MKTCLDCFAEYKTVHDCPEPGVMNEFAWGIEELRKIIKCFMVNENISKITLRRALIDTDDSLYDLSFEQNKDTGWTIECLTKQ